MKQSVWFLFFMLCGLFVPVLSGCEEEKKVDLTDWSVPGLEEKYKATEETVKHEEEAEPAVKKPKQLIHVVKKDEIIYEIAEKYGVEPERLAEVNGLALRGRKSIIYPGQKLVIPEK